LSLVGQAGGVNTFGSLSKQTVARVYHRIRRII
jgi:hypothetical protein